MKEEIIAYHTKRIVATGRHVLQIYQMGNTEGEHISALLDLMSPTKNAMVLDIGCGTGVIAKHMAELRPDIRFILLNDNKYQLSLCPSTMWKVHGDMHKVPLPPNVFDVVSIQYTLGHAEIDVLLAEVQRLLKKNGKLFIYDMEGYNPQLLPTLNYKTYFTDELEKIAKNFGLRLVSAVTPQATNNKFQGVVDLDPPTAGQVRKSIEGLRPVAWTFQLE